MLVLTSRKATLSPEQFECFLTMDADVRALCADEWRADAVSDALLNALHEGHVDSWRRLVQLIREVTALAPLCSPSEARGRLFRFVGENSDLLTADQ
jgi:hypothetical protein